MNIHAINFNSPGEVLLSEQSWKITYEDSISKQTTESHTQAVLTWTLCTIWLHELRPWIFWDEKNSKWEWMPVAFKEPQIHHPSQAGAAKRGGVTHADNADTAANCPSDTYSLSAPKGSRMCRWHGAEPGERDQPPSTAKGDIACWGLSWSSHFCVCLPAGRNCG